ncbi:hypothetical protein GCM10017774_41920 [Lentzea cavernae]|uniref:Uncharacterized protein n=1 Tax=Lentzea cavernae TaxID=2020703 RepID=A0ABQ3MH73_9PSEU|nr:hypothetical protein GCM10017774_41920 [Lentzea cavernae]
MGVQTEVHSARRVLAVLAEGIRDPASHAEPQNCGSVDRMTAGQRFIDHDHELGGLSRNFRFTGHSEKT